MPTTTFENWPNLANAPVLRGVTALAGGGNAGAPEMQPGYNMVDTVATSGDSVQMPISRPNLSVEVCNYSATTMWLYVNQNEPGALFEVPPGSSYSAAAHIVITTGLNARIVCGVKGTWSLLN